MVLTLGFPSGSVVKNPPANSEYSGLIPGLGRSPRVGNGNLLQYSCLENSMDRGAWWAIYSPWGCKELEMIECVYTHTNMYTHTPSLI